MPTGIALGDARSMLFAAGRRVLERDGANGLTSRAVTEESGVAKGVLHRHFANFDAFLIALVREEIARIAAVEIAASSRSVAVAVTETLETVFTPTMLGLVRVVISRDAVRHGARDGASGGIPLLTDAAVLVTHQLETERDAGHVRADADTSTLALTLIGTAHLLFAGELGALPDGSAVYEVVESILVGAPSALENTCGAEFTNSPDAPTGQPQVALPRSTGFAGVSTRIR